MRICVPTSRSFLPLLAVLSLLPGAQAGAPLTVDVKAEPSDAKWQARPTRTVDRLENFTPVAAVDTSRWGGWTRHREGAGTGFFRVAQGENGRWWLVDPEGYRFLHVGVAGVYQGTEDIAAETTRKMFPSTRAWAEFTMGLLRENGFNGLGGWTERDAVRESPAVLPYTVSLDFTADFGRSLKITHQNPGQTGYINEVPPILHPDFAAWCEQYAGKRLPRFKGDPMIVGFFSDNELPLKRDLLDRSLKLDPAIAAVAPLRQAALDWLNARRGSAAASASAAEPAAPTDEERAAFVGHVCERYFSTVAAALRRHDPDHLYLGSRFHGSVTQIPEVFRAAGPHVDVVSVNLYHAWSAKPDRLAMWTRESGRPVVVTEFYAKGMDSGLENDNGAGWVVKTQEDRGLFYQNFTLSLLEARNVVGWHWFKYRDNEHFDDKAQEGNRNSNKGVVSWDYKPYAPLLARMRELNAQVYPLTDYFDRVEK